MPTLFPEVEQQEQVVIETESTWCLLAHNDDVTPAILVVFALVAIGLTKEDAMKKTHEIDTEGTSFLLRGLTKEDAMKKKAIVVEITQDGASIGWPKKLPGLDVSIIQDS